MSRTFTLQQVQDAVSLCRKDESETTTTTAFNVAVTALQHEERGELSGQSAQEWLEGSKYRTQASTLAAKAIRHLRPVEAP